MKRPILVVAAAAAVLLSGWPSAAAPAPARSGRIVGYWFAGGGLGPGPNECSWIAECLAWKTSGCRADVAAKVPGLHASIVNVRGLGGTKQWWRVDVVPEWPGVVWGGLSVEVWSRDCRKLRLSGDDVWDGMVRDVETRTVVRIPRAAEWLTLTSADNTTVRWTLRRAG